MKTITIRRWDRYFCCQKKYFTSELAALIEHIDRAMATAPVILKKGNSSTVVQLVLGGRICVVKRANTRHMLHFLRRLFQSSRAMKNWIFSQELKKSHIHTFEPIAMMEKRWGPFRRQSYFICDFLAGKDLLHSFQPGGLPRESWHVAARVVKDLILTLAREGYYHRDLNLSNFILVDDIPYLIDLDSMRRYTKSRLTEFLLKKKLWSRFMKNIRETVGKESDIFRLFDNMVV